MNTMLFSLMAVCLMAFASTDAEYQYPSGQIYNAGQYPGWYMYYPGQTVYVNNDGKIVYVESRPSSYNKDSMKIPAWYCPRALQICREGGKFQHPILTCESIERVCSPMPTDLTSLVVLEKSTSKPEMVEITEPESELVGSNIKLAVETTQDPTLIPTEAIPYDESNIEDNFVDEDDVYNMKETEEN